MLRSTLTPPQAASGRQKFGFNAVLRIVTSVFILLSITLFAYGMNTNRLGLYQDDWRNLGDLIMHEQIVQKTARPINLAVLTLGWNLYGPNIQAYLQTATLLQFVSALMYWLLLYVMLQSFGYQKLAFPIAALFLVYPSVYSRIWYTLWPHSLLLTIFLAGVLTYALYIKHQSNIWIFLSLLLLGVSLFWYELQLALIASLSLLGIRQLRCSNWVRRFFIVSPTLLAVTYFLWWFFAPTNSKEYGPANITLSLAEILLRFVKSYYTILLVAWIEPIRFLGPSTLSRSSAIAIFAALAIVIIGGSFLLSRLLVRHNPQSAQQPHILGRNSQWLLFVGAGFLVIGLGTLPGLPRTEIGVEIFASRFTLFGALGASVLIVFLLYGVGKLVFKQPLGGLIFTYCVCVFLVIVATIYQLGAQRAMIAGWERQKCAWHSMLAQAPSFQDGTYVHIIDVPAEPGIWSVAPFGILVSEVDSPLKLLYANTTLNGSYHHQGNAVSMQGIQFRLTPAGILDEDTKALIPYEKAVLFRYGVDDSLELLTELPPELTGATEPIPTGTNRIFEKPVYSPYRSFIEPQPQCAYSS
jgi:hypothetical protein